MTPSTPFRLLALVLVLVVLFTVTTPARAEADVMAAIALGTLVIAGVILVVYLIVANVAEHRAAGEEPRIQVVGIAIETATP
jgi:hypothetical protein